MTKRRPGETLLWDFWRSWINNRQPTTLLFTLPPAPPAPTNEPGEPHYDYGSKPFLFERYGVMLECPKAYAPSIMRGVTATFVITGPDKDIFSFPNVNARWMFPDDLCEVKELLADKAPPQGMSFVSDVCGGRSLGIPPFQGFHVRLDFKLGALDAIWAAQQRQERIKLTYLMGGVFGG